MWNWLRNHNGGVFPTPSKASSYVEKLGKRFSAHRSFVKNLAARFAMVGQARGAIFASFTVLGLLASLAHRKRTSYGSVSPNYRAVPCCSPCRRLYPLLLYYTHTHARTHATHTHAHTHTHRGYTHTHTRTHACTHAGTHSDAHTPWQWHAWHDTERRHNHSHRWNILSKLFSNYFSHVSYTVTINSDDNNSNQETK